nr:helix-turn-helix transcriptional regulator [Pseudoalteromonas caenipelagi]
MRGAGRVIGVKFALAANLSKHGIAPHQCVDKRILAREKFAFAAQLTQQLIDADDDNSIVNALRDAVKPLCLERTEAQLSIQQLVAIIKNTPEVTQVEQLSQRCGMSIRTLQRHFKAHIGLSPKWLIRKYRMHQVLALLESQTKSLTEVAMWLGYTDQAHFIKDFKHFTGVTPAAYSHEC